MLRPSRPRSPARRRSPRVLRLPSPPCQWRCRCSSAQHRAEVSAYSAERPGRELLIQLIKRTIGNEDLGDLRMEPLPAKNWVAEAESLRSPVRAGPFLMHGAHDPGEVHEIDAGFAFGTRGCLLALDACSSGAALTASSTSASVPASSLSPPPRRSKHAVRQAIWIRLPSPSRRKIRGSSVQRQGSACRGTRRRASGIAACEV